MALTLAQEYQRLLMGGPDQFNPYAALSNPHTGVRGGETPLTIGAAVDASLEFARRKSAYENLLGTSGGAGGFGAGASGAAGGVGGSGVSYVDPAAVDKTNVYENYLKDLLADPSKIQQTAGYKFRQQQGQEALERSLGAKGLLRSGNRLQELLKYGEGLASQEYDTQMNRLGSLTGQQNQYILGQTTAAQQAANARNTFNLGAGELALKSLLGNRELNLREQSMARTGSGISGGSGRTSSGWNGVFNAGGIQGGPFNVVDVEQERAARRMQDLGVQSAEDNADRAWGRNLRAAYGLG